jgi:hypothetical protein
VKVLRPIRVFRALAVLQSAAHELDMKTCHPSAQNPCQRSDAKVFFQGISFISLWRLRTKPLPAGVD